MRERGPHLLDPLQRDPQTSLILDPPILQAGQGGDLALGNLIEGRLLGEALLGQLWPGIVLLHILDFFRILRKLGHLCLLWTPKVE